MITKLLTKLGFIDRIEVRSYSYHIYLQPIVVPSDGKVYVEIQDECSRLYQVLPRGKLRILEGRFPPAWEVTKSFEVSQTWTPLNKRWREFWETGTIPTTL